MKTKALKREYAILYIFMNLCILPRENSDTIRVLLTLDFIISHNSAFLMQVHITGSTDVFKWSSLTRDLEFILYESFIKLLFSRSQEKNTFINLSPNDINVSIISQDRESNCI